MALQKARQYQYKPSTKRRKQLAERDGEEFEREQMDLPKAGDGRTSAGGQGGVFTGLRLFLMFAAVVALAFVLATLG
jgi:hypothetical protein